MSKTTCLLCEKKLYPIDMERLGNKAFLLDTPEADKFEIKEHVPHSFWHRDGAYKASKKLLSEGCPIARTRSSLR